MSQNTTIEWTDSTWNPVRGCSLVSAGCTNCYAMHVAARFHGAGQPYEGLTVRTSQGPKWTGKIMLVPGALAQPLKWRRPRRIFVNSMSDLFHPEVPNAFIDQVFAVMALAPHHTFQVLTKRTERMREYCLAFDWARVIKSCTGPDGVSTIEGYTLQALSHHFGQVQGSPLHFEHRDTYPLPNVWLGTSVEDQAAADARIPLLLSTPAAVRFLSMEPLLGAVDLTGHLYGRATPCDDCPKDADCGCGWYPRGAIDGEPVLDWVIVGGESGRDARPMHPQWARDIRDQCAAAGVPFHFKQNGEWVSVSEVAGPGEHHKFPDGATVRRTGKKLAGRTLDGQVHDGFPEAR